jgi:hypothetical protein
MNHKLCISSDSTPPNDNIFCAPVLFTARLWLRQFSYTGIQYALNSISSEMYVFLVCIDIFSLICRILAPAFNEGTFFEFALERKLRMYEKKNCFSEYLGLSDRSDRRTQIIA